MTTLVAEARRRASLAATVALLAAVVATVVIGTGFRSSQTEFHATGAWLAVQGTDDRSINHVDPATGQVDVKIRLPADIVDGHFEVAQGDEGVYLVETASCRVHRLDQARLNISKRPPGTPAHRIPGLEGERRCGAANIVMGGGAVLLWGEGPTAGQVTIEQVNPRSLRDPLEVPEVVIDGTLAYGRAVVGDEGRLFLTPDDTGRVLVVHDGAQVDELDLFPDGAHLRMSRVGDRILAVDRRAEAATSQQRAVVLDGDGSVVHRLALPGDGDLWLADAQEGPWAWLAAEALDGAGHTLAAVDVARGEVAADAVAVPFRPRRPVGAPGFAVVADRSVSAHGLVVSVDGEPQQSSLELDRPVEETELLDVAGHRWFHSHDSFLGWVCDGGGRCTSFNKSRAALEVEATDPEQEDPEPDLEARSTTTTTVVVVPDAAGVDGADDQIDPDGAQDDPAARTTVPPLTGGSGDRGASVVPGGGGVGPSGDPAPGPDPGGGGAVVTPPSQIDRASIVLSQTSQSQSPYRVRASWGAPSSWGTLGPGYYQAEVLRDGVRVAGPFEPVEPTETFALGEGDYVFTVRAVARDGQATSVGSPQQRSFSVRAAPRTPDLVLNGAVTTQPGPAENEVAFTADVANAGAFRSIELRCTSGSGPPVTTSVDPATLRSAEVVGGLAPRQRYDCSLVGRDANGESAPGGAVVAVAHGSPSAPTCTPLGVRAVRCELDGADRAVNELLASGPYRVCLEIGGLSQDPCGAFGSSSVEFDLPHPGDWQVRASAEHRTYPGADAPWFARSVEPPADGWVSVEAHLTDAADGWVVSWSLRPLPELQYQVPPTATVTVNDAGGLAVPGSTVLALETAAVTVTVCWQEGYCTATTLGLDPTPSRRMEHQ
ncbi:MAG: hypothetical protein JJU45_20345 [Acidimicrobiia bacterium]|nr:hypothetical protein [Acidimicrobiia bacterium]